MKDINKVEKFEGPDRFWKRDRVISERYTTKAVFSYSGRTATISGNTRPIKDELKAAGMERNGVEWTYQITNPAEFIKWIRDLDAKVELYAETHIAEKI